MKKTNWNQGWIFYDVAKEKAKKVIDLPHDAMIGGKRLPEYGSASGFFGGGKYVYEKSFTADEDFLSKTVFLEFEGVYMNSVVSINGEQVGGHIYGYTNYFVDLTGKLVSGKNTVRITVDNSAQPNSRWYTGSGIYRDVNMYVGGDSYFVPDGIKITTVSYRPAVIQVQSETVGNGEVFAEIVKDGKQEVHAAGKSFVVEIPNAELWSADSPKLYELRLKIENDGRIADEETVVFGIRKLSWDASCGFTVNGKTVKLKGGCIHHDNGLLGACEYKKAARRRIRKLKEFGFNAIRYSHYPASKQILEACDELGMYVIDESFDQWRVSQSKFDYALYFDAEWKKDLEALIRKDYNHPSVSMYSIGNEITDVALPWGKEIAKELCAFIKSRDAGRAVTIANNALLNVLTVKLAEQKKQAGDNKNVGSGDANEIVAQLPKIMESLTADMLESIAGETLSAVDIVGYNYGNNLYERTHELYPDRIVLGSETFPSRIGKNWEQVEKYPYLIGDFMWTAWDYIGEAGVGLPFYGTKQAPFSKPYPCMLAGCGSFDITGFPESQAYYSAVLWGAYAKPYIAVRPVDHSGEEYALGNWRLTDAQNSWSWEKQSGKSAEIFVYSIGDKIELLLNGNSIGKKQLVSCKAEFSVSYERGVLTAISYDQNGKEIARSELRSADDNIVIQATAEQSVIEKNDFTYVNIALTDEAGTVHMLCDRRVKVMVEGPGYLRAIGSGNPLTEESFADPEYTSYYGRLQAVIASKDSAGTIKVFLQAEGAANKSIEITVKS